jgi:hypothetical protein
VVWIAEQLADSHVATVRAVVEAASSGVTGVAVGLVVLGVGGWWGGVVWDRFPRSGAFAR